MAYATVAELGEYLGLVIPVAKDAFAARCLQEASNAIDDACRRSFVLVTTPAVRELAAPYGDELQLPDIPVGAVTNVVLIDPVGVWTTLAAADYYIRGDGVLVLLTGGSWGGPDARVRITYSHGPQATPAVVVDVTLSAASRVYGNPGGAHSFSIGTYSETSGEEETTPRGDLSPGELRRLERAGYRSSVASVPIGGRRD